MTQPDSNDPPDANNPNEAALERWLTELLREQPLRRAPPALAMRVMAALEHGERSAFQRWPLMVRIAFVALAGIAARLAAELSMFLIHAMQAGAATPRPSLAALLAEAALAAFRQLPSIWLYGGLAALVVIYGSAFGIGVAMYRITLSRNVSSQH